jgi:hypothetical protein
VSSWLPSGAREWGGRPIARRIAAATARRRAVLVGVVNTVSLGQRHGPRFEAVLDDGSGRITLCWVGRERVGGVEAGAHLLVEGTVLTDRGRLILLNPLYELVCGGTSGA